MKLAFVLPAFNERQNLSQVLSELSSVAVAAGFAFTLTVVDDGSTDGTAEELKVLQEEVPGLSYIRFSGNRGKSAALRAGFERALITRPDAVVMLDADGQDDPRELTRLIEAFSRGAGLVTGARRKRNDRLLKRWSSVVYNRATSLVMGVKGRDFNSGYKVLDPNLAAQLGPFLYGEIHRYITVLAAWLGFSTVEVEVHHRPRLAGKSKFGVERFWRGFFDLITVRFLTGFRFRPLHVFGPVGVLLAISGLSILVFLSALWLFGEGIGDRPLLLAGLLLFLAGLQTFFTGFLAELVVHTRSNEASPMPDTGSAQVPN